MNWRLRLAWWLDPRPRAEFIERGGGPLDLMGIVGPDGKIIDGQHIVTIELSDYGCRVLGAAPDSGV